MKGKQEYNLLLPLYVASEITKSKVKNGMHMFPKIFFTIEGLYIKTLFPGNEF